MTRDDSSTWNFDLSSLRFMGIPVVQNAKICIHSCFKMVINVQIGKVVAHYDPPHFNSEGEGVIPPAPKYFSKVDKYDFLPENEASEGSIPEIHSHMVLIVISIRFYNVVYLTSK